MPYNKQVNTQTPMERQLNIIKEGWDEELSKRTPEERELINNLKPHEVAGLLMLYFLNPLNWFSFFFPIVVGVIEGIKIVLVESIRILLLSLFKLFKYTK
jgi:hypothetical protein